MARTEFERPYIENESIWYHDSATRSFLRREGEILNTPQRMSNHKLVDAVTYCPNVDSPYTYEIIRRTKMDKQYDEAVDETAKCLVLKKACLQWGCHLGGYGLF